MEEEKEEKRRILEKHRRREGEERETRRQERELRRLEMETEIMRQKETAKAAKREHELEIARLGSLVPLSERIELRLLNSPCLWIVKMI